MLKEIEARLNSRNVAAISVDMREWNARSEVIAGYQHLPHDEQLIAWAKSKGFHVVDRRIDGRVDIHWK